MRWPQLGVSLDAARKAWNSTFLRDLPTAISDQLFDGSRVEHIEAGGTVLRGSKPAGFVIVEGVVRLYLCSQEGRQATIRYVEPGDIAGIPPVIRGEAWIWGDAITPVTLLRLPTERFKFLAQHEVSLAWAIALHLTEMMATTNDAMSATIFLPVRARIARHLLDLGERGHEGIVVRARHQQIANATGTVREVVSREMKHLAEDGLIERIPAGTLLVDLAELHRIASAEGDARRPVRHRQANSERRLALPPRSARSAGNR